MKRSRGFLKAPIIAAVFALALAFTACPSDVTPPVGWEASALTVGDANAITFTFNAPVRLSEGDILVTDSHGGTVVLGTLTGSGRHWTQVVRHARAATVDVSISARRVSSQVRRVTLASTVTDLNEWVAGFDIAANGVSAVIFTFTQPVTNLTAAELSITNGSGTVNVDWDSLRRVDFEGYRWAVNVEVVHWGNVLASVTRDGVVRDPGSAGDLADMTVNVGFITFTATAVNSNQHGGNVAGSPRTVAVDLAFTAPVELTQADVDILGRGVRVYQTAFGGGVTSATTDVSAAIEGFQGHSRYWRLDLGNLDLIGGGTAMAVAVSNVSGVVDSAVLVGGVTNPSWTYTLINSDDEPDMIGYMNHTVGFYLDFPIALASAPAVSIYPRDVEITMGAPGFNTTGVTTTVAGIEGSGMRWRVNLNAFDRGGYTDLGFNVQAPGIVPRSVVVGVVNDTVAITPVLSNNSAMSFPGSFPERTIALDITFPDVVTSLTTANVTVHAVGSVPVSNPFGAPPATSNVTATVTGVEPVIGQGGYVWRANLSVLSPLGGNLTDMGVTVTGVGGLVPFTTLVTTVVNPIATFTQFTINNPTDIPTPTMAQRTGGIIVSFSAPVTAPSITFAGVAGATVTDVFGADFTPTATSTATVTVYDAAEYGNYRWLVSFSPFTGAAPNFVGGNLLGVIIGGTGLVSQTHQVTVINPTWTVNLAGLPGSLSILLPSNVTSAPTVTILPGGTTIGTQTSTASATSTGVATGGGNNTWWNVSVTGFSQPGPASAIAIEVSGVPGMPTLRTMLTTP